jgi:TPP-dependent pyruvate/acetoin dehydrogenase alpha subunit
MLHASHLRPSQHLVHHRYKITNKESKFAKAARTQYRCGSDLVQAGAPIAANCLGISAPVATVIWLGVGALVAVILLKNGASVAVQIHGRSANPS